MKRCTTPTLEFVFPFDASEVVAILISLGQNDKVILTKTEDDCEKDGNIVRAMLSQEDTKALSSDFKTVEIELAYKLENGFVDRIKYTKLLEDCLNDEVI